MKTVYEYGYEHWVFDPDYDKLVFFETEEESREFVRNLLAFFEIMKWNQLSSRVISGVVIPQNRKG